MKLSSYLFKTIVTIHNLNPFKRAFCKLLKFLNFPKEKVFKDINFEGKFKVCFDKKKFFLYHFGDTISKHTFGMDYLKHGKTILDGFGKNFVKNQIIYLILEQTQECIV